MENILKSLDNAANKVVDLETANIFERLKEENTLEIKSAKAEEYYV